MKGLSDELIYQVTTPGEMRNWTSRLDWNPICSCSALRAEQPLYGKSATRCDLLDRYELPPVSR